MKKMIFIEGLPGVGKTTMVTEIKKMGIEGVEVVAELINPDIDNPFIDPEEVFLKNDEMKVFGHDNNLTVVDRGPISTLVYNQVNHLIDHSYDATYVEKWFQKFADIYNDESTYTYYLYHPEEYHPSLDDDKNPFGSIDNLKLTHALTLFNLKKYAKNFKVIEYRKNNMEEVINEIIN